MCPVGGRVPADSDGPAAHVALPRAVRHPVGLAAARHQAHAAATRYVLLFKVVMFE